MEHTFASLLHPKPDAMELTFEQLPRVVGELYEKLSNIESLLSGKQPQLPSEQWFDIHELRDYMPDRPAVSTIYLWSSKGCIPSHRRGKKLYFLKSEIDAWLKSGRRKTNAELSVEASAHLKRRKLAA